MVHCNHCRRRIIDTTLILTLSLTLTLTLTPTLTYRLNDRAVGKKMVMCAFVWMLKEGKSYGWNCEGKGRDKGRNTERGAAP